MNMITLKRGLAALAGIAAIGIVALGGAAPAGATTYSNVGQSVGPYWQPLGYPDTTAYGEVFNAPGGALQDWTAYFAAGNAGNVMLEVAAWNGTEAVGPALYASAPYAYAGGAATLNFSSINLSLTTGSSYITILTTAGVSSPLSAVQIDAANGAGGLSGSGFTYDNTHGADPLVTPNWTGLLHPDIQFTADFGAPAVPEPASLALMLPALLGLGLLSRRARRRA